MAKRRRFSPAFKAKVAIEAIKGQHSISEISARHEIHPNVVVQWKRALLDHAENAFVGSHSRAKTDDETLRSQLYQQIGQLKVELDWLKKKAGLSD
jgi:transposase